MRAQHRYQWWTLVIAGILLFLGGGALLAPPAEAVPVTTEWFASPLRGLDHVGQARDPHQGTPTATPTAICVPGAWNLVPSPNQGNDNNTLYGVAARAPDDIWAVGYYRAAGRFQTLIQHWNGSAWSIVPSPNPGTSHDNYLFAVTVLAADDAWAVGYYENATDGGSLILHWDGTAWTPVPSPNPTPLTVLFSISPVTPTDIWAVGMMTDIWPDAPAQGRRNQPAGPRIDPRQPNTAFFPVHLHWDGTVWSVVPGPVVSGYGALYGVSALATADVWAVGVQSVGVPTLTEHWDGTAWSVVSTPSSGSSMLLAVDAAAPTDVWAVGYNYSDNLALHWDGSAWSIVPTPNQGGTNFMAGVAAVAGHDAWTVGGDGLHTQIQRWDGSTWNLVPGPTPGSFNELRALAPVSATELWAVGRYAAGGSDRTLIARYFTTCASASPSPTPTRTALAASPTPTRTAVAPSPTLSATGVAASPTPTATAIAGSPTNTPTGMSSPTVVATPSVTACPIQFTDVDPTNPFYPFIRCLACRQIISGYADGTFRWGNDVTRGQLAKMITGAAGFLDAIPSTQQTFTDVPSSQPFWLPIERLYLHGAISGYTCGGPGEPCDPALRPYFRPYASLTRGQLAKIDAVAAGFNDPISSTQQSFEDVPPSNPFWLYIERVALHGIISGYSCGGWNPCTGLFEVCEPHPVAWFHWCSNVTRGQTAKIVANTFYPNCVTPARR